MRRLSIQNGISLIEVNSQQHRELQQLFTDAKLLISTGISSAHHLGTTFEEKNITAATAHFTQDFLPALFPGFPPPVLPSLHSLQTRRDNYPITLLSQREAYYEFPLETQEKELGIASTIPQFRRIRTPLRGEHPAVLPKNPYRVVLSIFPFPKERTYGITLFFDRDYEPGALDDLVDRTRKKQQQFPSGYSEVYSRDHEGKKKKLIFYALPAVLELQDVLDEYTRLGNILDQSDEIIGVSEYSLNVLRRDAYGTKQDFPHENAFVRHGSKELYGQYLQVLLTQK